MNSEQKVGLIEMMTHVERITLIAKLKFKTSMLKSSLCDYNDGYILFKRTISIKRLQAPAALDNDGKYVVFKNLAPFTDCISEINKIQIDNAKEIDVVMPMYNLRVYSDNYSKTYGSLKQCYRDERVLTDAGAVANFHAADNSVLFKSKQKCNRCNGC